MNSLKEALDALHGPVDEEPEDDPAPESTVNVKVPMPAHSHPYAEPDHAHDMPDHHHVVEPHEHPELMEAIDIALGTQNMKTLPVRDPKTGLIAYMIREDGKARIVRRDAEGRVLSTSPWIDLPPDGRKAALQRFELPYIDATLADVKAST